MKAVQLYLIRTAILAVGMAAVALASPALLSAEPNLSLKNEISRGLDKGTEWLAKNQDPQGFWSTKDHPAVTGLALVALQGRKEAARAEVLKKGYEYLLSCAHEDGSVWGKKELVNYNTAISTLAFLAATNSPASAAAALKARRYLIGSQLDLGAPGVADTAFDGGFGYMGPQDKQADLGNTLQVLETLYYSRHLVKDQAATGPDLNYAAAIHFLQSCQNLPGRNPEPWASDDAANKGGFVYSPGTSKAGQTNLPSGKVALRSTGSISYAGLLSYIYADVKKDDPRVKAVLQWLSENYTLEENPGLGPQGLYYYFHTMTKALNACGLDEITGPDGKPVAWREKLALRLLDLQKADGSWANDNGRWWEKDPALVTSYALLCLEMISNRL